MIWAILFELLVKTRKRLDKILPKVKDPEVRLAIEDIIEDVEKQEKVMGMYGADPKLMSSIPKKTKDAIDRYILCGHKAGDFTMGCLTNDLKIAVGYADKDNYSNLDAVIKYIYNYIPSIAHGSPEQVEEWLELHRAGKFSDQQIESFRRQLERSGKKVTIEY